MTNTNINQRPDLCVIGAGAAGLSVAAGASQLGLKTTLVEAHLMGGECLNTGCVPSKSILACAAKLTQAQACSQFGGRFDNREFDFSAVHAAVHQAIATIAPHDSVTRFESLGVEVVIGQAHFVSPTQVALPQAVIEPRYTIIATGSKPRIPKIPGIDTVPVWTNENIFSLKTQPQHLLVIGGGPIACELALAHAELGSKVSILVRSALLREQDQDAAAIIKATLQQAGVNLFEGVNFEAVATTPAGVELKFTQSDQAHSITGSHLLVAAGRVPNVEGLNLAAATVATNAQGILVSPRLKTTNRRIFALGDVVGAGFTHACAAQAGVVIKNLAFKLPARYTQALLPKVVYTHPELAQLGLTAAAAQARLGGVSVQEVPFTGNDRAICEAKTQGFIKVVTQKDKVVGVTLVGDHAGELLLPWTLMMQQQLPLRALTDCIVAYPTLSEISKRAASQYYQPMVFSDRMRKLVRLLQRLCP